MAQDIIWKAFLSDDGRYADIINGIIFNGRQEVAADSLQDMDTQTGFQRGQAKIRDTIRKAAFGVNYAVAGCEEQETIDYSVPLRNMSYDVGEYEKQADKIRKKVKADSSGLKKGEYLYSFRKDSRLHPVVTIILYAGSEAWDGPESLHDMLDFTDIPEEIRKMTPDYKINLVEIRKLEDTSVFKTDVRQVFDFIRCSADKNALEEFIEQDESYKSVEQDAFDVMAHYAKAEKLVEVKDYCMKEGKVDMSSALALLIAEGEEKGRAEGLAKGRTEGLAKGRTEGLMKGRTEGLAKGRTEGIDEKTRLIVRNMLARNMPVQDICAIAECSEELVKEVKKLM